MLQTIDDLRNRKSFAGDQLTSNLTCFIYSLSRCFWWAVTQSRTVECHLLKTVRLSHETNCLFSKKICNTNVYISYDTCLHFLYSYWMCIENGQRDILFILVHYRYSMSILSALDYTKYLNILSSLT